MADAGKTAYSIAEYQELRKRVIRADNALRCCSSAEKRVAMEALSIVNSVLQAYLEASEQKKGYVLALAPWVSAGQVSTGLQRVIWITGAEAATLGLVVLGAAAELADIAKQTGALEAAEMVARVVGTMTETRVSSCYECMKRSVLSQSHPRHREKTKINRRL